MRYKKYDDTAVVRPATRKVLPYSIKEVDSKEEIKAWQAASELRSKELRANRRSNAIAAFERPKTQEAPKACTPVSCPLPKESIFTRIYNYLFNLFTNINLNS